MYGTINRNYTRRQTCTDTISLHESSQIVGRNDWMARTNETTGGRLVMHIQQHLELADKDSRLEYTVVGRAAEYETTSMYMLHAIFCMFYKNELHKSQPCKLRGLNV